MRQFYCQCGQEVFLENSFCIHCASSLGYNPLNGAMVTLEQVGSTWQIKGEGKAVGLCENRMQYGICNAIVEKSENSALCLVCRLNRTIPDLRKPENFGRWTRLEQAKRRLIFGLLALGLPLEAPVAGYPRGLCFDFLEDQRSNPDALQEYVTTGHHQGVITINVLEADDVQRVWQRQQSSERYRTLLGHFRHEAGHYYFELLIRKTEEFVSLFGDFTLPYKDALALYYNEGPLPGWEQNYISAYASSHPLEDWAECFAHYLHMQDTLETAHCRGVISPLDMNDSIEHRLQVWDQLTVTLNELNRSMGLRDAYPFVVTPAIAEKLCFVDQAIKCYQN